MNIEELFSGIDEFEKQDKLSTVDTSNFNEADRLELEIQEDEVRKHINLLESQRGERDDEDVDIDIKKAKHSLLSKESELVSKYKPVPTDEPAPEKPVGNFGKLGDAVNSFNEFTDNMRDEMFAPLKPATDLFTEQIKKIGNAIGGTAEDAWNWIANDDADVYEKLRAINKDKLDELNKTLDPKGKAVFSPDESAQLITEMIPVVKAKSSAEAFAGMEGFLGYVRGYDKEGDIGEGVKEAGISTAFSLVGGHLAGRFFPDEAKEVPTDFAKKINALGKDDSLAINKVLDNLDVNDIHMMNEDARDQLIEQVMSKSGSTDEIAANVKAMLKINKKEAQKSVTEAYDAANVVARETDAIPTTGVLTDVSQVMSGTRDEKKAFKEIKTLLKGKRLNAEDMESALSDLKTLQRSAKNKGTNTYGKAIESLTAMQKGLDGDDIYGEARALSKKFNQDYTGKIKGGVGGQVAKVLEDDIGYQVGEALVGKNVNPNKIGTAVKGLSSGNKMQIVQDILAKNVDDITTPDGVTQFVRNYNAIDKEGLKVLLGKETADKLKLNIESIATVEGAILDATGADTAIAREVMDIATAMSMASLSPFLAARSTMHGIKKIVNKKALNKQRFELIDRVKTIKDKPLRNKMTKAISVLMTPENIGTFKSDDKFDELVKEADAKATGDAKEVDAVAEKPTEKATPEARSIFSDDDYSAFDSEYKEDDAPKQKVEWGRAMGREGRGVYSGSRPSSSIANNQYGTSSGEGNDRVFEKLSEREGNKDYSYKDSRGMLTGGIGHLLTPSEKKKYPKGTKIPVSQIKTWYKQDTRKARNAAKMQAKELGLPKLEEALIHVNFQLGTNWKKKFKETYPLLKKGNFAQAINNLKRSAWMKQTPKRVNDFIAEIQKLRG